jgi:hypothetical protein
METITPDRAEKTVDTPPAPHKSKAEQYRHKKFPTWAKRLLWILGGVIVAAALAGLTIKVVAFRAAETWRSDIVSQLNTVIAGKNTAPVAIDLKNVPLGGVLDSHYKKAADLQTTYQKLLQKTKGYVAVLNVHNALTKQYNTGVSGGDQPLSGDLLKSVNQYAAVVQANFPDAKDQIKALNDLSSTITSNSDFASVSDPIDQVLSANDQWLNQMRSEISQETTKFSDDLAK